MAKGSRGGKVGTSQADIDERTLFVSKASNLKVGDRIHAYKSNSMEYGYSNRAEEHGYWTSIREDKSLEKRSALTSEELVIQKIETKGNSVKVYAGVDFSLHYAKDDTRRNEERLIPYRRTLKKDDLIQVISRKRR